MTQDDQAAGQPQSLNSGGSEIRVNPQIIARSDWAFRISYLSFAALLLLFILPFFLSVVSPGRESFNLGMNLQTDNVLLALVGNYFPHLLLFSTTMVSAYIGYKLAVAAGANPENPIPPANYKLLAPLIADAKSEAITQYVRLSSLSGFTGMFTKLGLTGLPLTTVILTLVFAVIALLPTDNDTKKSFMDLTKLTLGAFIGSFVQRQVEQRETSREPTPRTDEARVQ